MSFTILKDCYRYLLGNLRTLVDMPSNPDSQLYWAYLLTFLLLALFAFFQSGGKGKMTPAAFLDFCFPREIYSHPSCKTDLGLFLIKFVLFPLNWPLSIISMNFLMIFVYKTLSWHFPPPWHRFPPNQYIHLFIFALVFLLQDFAVYLTHYWQHRLESLWEFHRVHHSAPVLNPFTLFRVHPVDDLLKGLLIGTFMSLSLGVLLYLFLGDLRFLSLINMTIGYRLFMLLGSNLRHSHLWISYGPTVSRLLMSPAQHQIHHSVDQRHHNRNFGEMFAVWDWMFGTLYIPQGKMVLKFGLGEGEGEGVNSEFEFRSFKDVLLLPLRNSLQSARRKFLRSGQPRVDVDMGRTIDVN